MGAKTKRLDEGFFVLKRMNVLIFLKEKFFEFHKKSRPGYCNPRKFRGNYVVANDSDTHSVQHMNGGNFRSKRHRGRNRSSATVTWHKFSTAVRILSPGSVCSVWRSYWELP